DVLRSVEFGCLTFREQTKLRVFRIYRETLSRFRAPLQFKKRLQQDIKVEFSLPRLMVVLTQKES
ncbi:hypothetical protein AAHB56_12500, partial [Bacillus thuringiensis]